MISLERFLSWYKLAFFRQSRVGSIIHFTQTKLDWSLVLRIKHKWNGVLLIIKQIKQLLITLLLNNLTGGKGQAQTIRDKQVI